MTRTPQHPSSALTTDESVHEFVSGLIGRAIVPRFWMLFLDDEQRILRDIMPVDGIPDRPDVDDAERMVPMFCGCADALDAEAMILVLERCGPRDFSEDDRAWARTLREGAARADVDVRAILLSHSSGVRWMAPDDYLF
jgi:hypothetical protein